MTVTYGVIRENYILGAAERTSYGIAAYSDADIDGLATIIAHVSDITSDEAKAVELAELCTRLELSPMHLYDVVEDFIG